MFKDRKDAGKKLAATLSKYKDKGVIVLSIPRGGVEVGYEVASALNADFSIIVSRKLPFPDNPESGFGAVAEDGSIFIFENYRSLVPEKIVNEIIKQQKEEIKRRISVLRKDKPLPSLKGRTVILVDDGIAMGSTMYASIELCKNQKAKKIIVAVPVSGKDTAENISRIVDEIIVLEQPLFFQAVAQVYRNWYDVTDEEVIDILNRKNRIKP